MQEWNEQKLLEALPGNSGGRLPGRSTERKVSQMRAERKGKLGPKSIKKWLRASRRGPARMKMPSRLHKEQLGKHVKQSWDSSQIENEEEEEYDWQKEDQMEMQWVEDEKLEEIPERRRREGNSLQAEVMQKVPE